MSSKTWLPFPGAHSPKLWVDEKSSLKAAFELYHPYALLPVVIKKLVEVLPASTGDLFLGLETGGENNKLFAAYKKSIDDLLQIDSIINISPGTPSKHQKTTVQIVSKNKTVYFLKISEKPAAIALSKNECSILKYLDRFEFPFQIPSVRYGGGVGQKYFLIQTGPESGYRQCAKEFCAAHAEAIVSLFHAKVSDANLSEYLKMSRMALVCKKSAEETKLIINKIEEIAGRYKGIHFKCAISHGDFTPWNMLKNSKGSLYIFDWEHGSEEMPLLTDFFHYHYMTLKNIGKHSVASIKSGLVGLFENRRYNYIFDRMNIDRAAFGLYLQLYMLNIVTREISENDLPAEVSIRVMESL